MEDHLGIISKMNEIDQRKEIVVTILRIFGIPLLLLVFTFLKNPRALCLRLLQIIRCKTWVFLLASKLFEKFQRYGLLKNEGGLEIIAAMKASFAWEYYNVWIVCIALAYYRDRPDIWYNDGIRLKIVKNIICAHIAYFFMEMNIYLMVFQVVFMFLLMLAYWDDIPPGADLPKALMEDMRKGLLYAGGLVFIFSSFLLMIGVIQYHLNMIAQV